jgi:hypothetical protein
VVANGPKYHSGAREVLKNYPDVTAFYLPQETGDYGAGGSMADVFAGMSFLTRADWVFFLDDDNFYDPNHVASVMDLVERHDLQWAYSLRKYVSLEGKFICEDNWCSLGHWPCLADSKSHLVDNSCYAVSLDLAKRCSLAWTKAPYIGDRFFFKALHETNTKAGCTGLYTANYRVGTGSGISTTELLVSDYNVKKSYPNGVPWSKESIT